MFFLTGCPETVSCPDGQVFDENGRCILIVEDAGSDAGRERG